MILQPAILQAGNITLPIPDRLVDERAVPHNAKIFRRRYRTLWTSLADKGDLNLGLSSPLFFFDRVKGLMKVANKVDSELKRILLLIPLCTTHLEFEALQLGDDAITLLR